MLPSDSDIWERLVKTYKEYLSTMHEIQADGVDRVSIVREGLRGPDRWIALKLAQDLDGSEQLELFDSYVCGASTGNSGVDAFRDLILSLPRDWVIERIESAAEPYLSDGTEDEYRRFLELYIDMDRGLTLKLARRAATNPDPDIKEAGEDFLQKLGESNV